LVDENIQNSYSSLIYMPEHQCKDTLNAGV